MMQVRIVENNQSARNQGMTSSLCERIGITLHYFRKCQKLPGGSSNQEGKKRQPQAMKVPVIKEKLQR